MVPSAVLAREARCSSTEFRWEKSRVLVLIPEIQTGCLQGCACARRCRPFRPPASRRRRLRSAAARSEEHTSELQSLMRISYAVFCLNKNTNATAHTQIDRTNQSIIVSVSYTLQHK